MGGRGKARNKSDIWKIINNRRRRRKRVNEEIKA